MKLSEARRLAEWYRDQGTPVIPEFDRVNGYWTLIPRPFKGWLPILGPVIRDAGCLNRTTRRRLEQKTKDCKSS